jgi:hypothetical protein
LLFTQDADIICGVVVAIQGFGSSSAKRGAGRILVLTDGSAIPAPGKDVLDTQILDKIAAQGLAVDVFAIGNWGDEASGPSAHDSDMHSKPDPASVGFRPLLRELARVSGGCTTSLDSAIAVIGSLRARAVAQRTKYRVDLDIGRGAVRIPVFGYSYTAEAKVESLKKTTVRAVTRAGNGPEGDEDADDDEDGGVRAAKDVTLERGYMRISAASTEGAVEEGADAEVEPAMLSSSDAAVAEILTPEEVAKAYKYGGTFIVPVAGDDHAWKLAPTEKSFKVLGFQPAKTFQRYGFMAAADVIVAKPPSAVPEGGASYSDAASTALSALARALALDGMVGVARLVYQSNAAPKVR